MAYEKKDNKGFLFVNKDKLTDKHPTSKGYLVLSKALCERMIKHNDFEINLSAWLNDEKKYNSISVDEYQFNKRNSTTTEEVSFNEHDSIPM